MRVEVLQYLTGLLVADMENIFGNPWWGNVAEIQEQWHKIEMCAEDLGVSMNFLVNLVNPSVDEKKRVSVDYGIDLSFHGKT